MKLASLRTKFSKPCNKMLHLFKLKLRRPTFLFAPSLRFHRLHRKIKAATGCLPRLRFIQRRRKEELDCITELTSFSDGHHLHHHKEPCPSPLTPAYIRICTDATKRDYDDVEDACRSFGSYLIDMIVEDGKMKDLADVEELLYCWKSLRSPMFVDLVCQFYAELYNDLFSDNSTSGVKTSPKKG